MEMLSTSSSPIHTAVIGFGLAGRVFHCPFIFAVPGLTLAAIVQRHGGEAGVRYPSARILRTAEEAISDPSVQLIVVATPNETHFDLASQALAAGKHVVVDKPFASSSEEALRLIAIARNKGLILAPFHNRRFDGDFLTVRKLLAEGRLGRCVEMNSRFDRFRPLQRPNTWKEKGGDENGLLFDLGPHLVDQALALFGVPDAVCGSVRRDRDNTEIDDAFDIALSYKQLGLRYRCGATLLAADAAPRFRVHGTMGSYTKNGVDPQEAALVAGARPPVLGSDEPWLPEPQTCWGMLTVAPEPREPAKLERSTYPTVAGDYRQFYANVRDAIRERAALDIPPENGYLTVKLLEYARQSSQTGCELLVEGQL